MNISPKLLGPMITYLLPVMIGSTGGHLVGGKRSAVIGGIGTIGVIVGAEIDVPWLDDYGAARWSGD